MEMVNELDQRLHILQNQQHEIDAKREELQVMMAALETRINDCRKRKVSCAP
jgi:predicted transcriptional regulator